MHIEVYIVDKETFANCCVSICECVCIKPIMEKLNEDIETYSISSSRRGQLFCVIISFLSVKMDDIFQSVSAYNFGSSSAPAVLPTASTILNYSNEL